MTERLQIRPPTQSATHQSSPVDLQDSTFLDPRTYILAWLYEVLTGHPPQISSFQPHSQTPPAAPANTSWGVSFTHQEIHRESEGSAFSAEGTVKLKDGSEISFSLNLVMNREQTEVNTLSFSTGNMSDPIVVNFDGQGARLSGEQTAFDLNGDGVKEIVATLTAGSAWLARDVNGNGQVDNGREFFGPSTGNGSAELAALDADGNGWIDAGDPAYSQMGVLQDQHFTSLQDAGIGALGVASVASPFALKEGAALLGEVNRSGVYLTDEGKAGVLQQVDLSV